MTDAQIAAVIRRVSPHELYKIVGRLSGPYPTRHTQGANLRPAATWLRAQFRARGYRNVRFHEYEKAGLTLPNVVAVKPGKTAQTIIVGAHFDSRMQDLNDAKSPAPGANDNGSGVAAVLEIARLLKDIPTGPTIRFVLFSGEEQGYWGSAPYAASVKAERVPVRFMFNLDEIGCPPRDRALFVDRDKGNATRSNDAESARLVAKMQKLARNVVHVPTRVDPAENSDYMPFEAQGWPIVGIYEAGKYAAYHTSDDTLEKVDFLYVASATRLALALLLSEAAL